MSRNKNMPKLYKDIVELKETDNWEAKASYGDKKRQKLWIMVELQNTNNYIESRELNESLGSSILFIDGQFSEIVWISHNGNMLEDINQVDEKLRNIMIDTAIELSKKYL